MLDQLKNMAARRVGKVLASDATMKVVADPRVQKAMMRAINMRADARELVEQRVQNVAAVLDLVTREDVASLKRTIRDLEDTVEELRDELSDTQEEAGAARREAKTAQEQAVAANEKAEAAAKKPAARKSSAKGTRKRTAAKGAKASKPDASA